MIVPKAVFPDPSVTVTTEVPALAPAVKTPEAESIVPAPEETLKVKDPTPPVAVKVAVWPAIKVTRDGLITRGAELIVTVAVAE